MLSTAVPMAGAAPAAPLLRINPLFNSVTDQPHDMAGNPRSRMQRLRWRMQHFQVPRFDSSRLALLGNAVERARHRVDVRANALWHSASVITRERGQSVRDGWKRGVKDHGEEMSGATYVARLPSLCIAADNAPRSSAPESAISDITNVLSTVGAVVSVGGNVLETALAVHRFREGESTITLTAHAKTELDNSAKVLRGMAPAVADSSASIQDSVVTLKKIHTARADVRSRKKATLERPEKAVDLLRYTAVSWTNRAISIASAAVSHGASVATVAGSALHLAAGVFGIVSGVAQLVSGLVKWRAARKAIALGRLNLEAAPKAVAGDSELLLALKHHILVKRTSSLARSKLKQRNAIVETSVGALVAGFTAGAIAFPPLIFGTIAVSMGYVCYRVYLGAKSLRDWRKNQRNQQATDEFIYHHDTTDAARIQADYRYALHCAYEDFKLQRSPEQVAQWNAFLQSCGVPEVESNTLRLMIDTASMGSEDQKTAKRIFNEMVLGDHYLEHSSRATAPFAVQPVIPASASASALLQPTP